MELFGGICTMTQKFNAKLLKEKMESLYEEAREEYVERHNTPEAYEETLNEAYGSVTICGMEYDQGTAYRELDPIGFRCDNSDEADHYYEMFDEENEIEDFQDQAFEALDMEDEE